VVGTDLRLARGYESSIPFQTCPMVALRGLPHRGTAWHLSLSTFYKRLYPPLCYASACAFTNTYDCFTPILTRQCHLI